MSNIVKTSREVLDELIATTSIVTEPLKKHKPKNHPGRIHDNLGDH